MTTNFFVQEVNLNTENIHGGVGVLPADGGEVRVCAAGGAGTGYDTLCGKTLNGELFIRVPISDRVRINCPMCRATWSLAKAFTAKDFA